MTDFIKLRARFKAGVTEVKAIMTHPMETGRRKDELGDVVPAHFIQTVTVALNGKPVIEAQWGVGVSKNPYLTYRLASAKPGDTISLAWQDNQGGGRLVETVVEAEAA